jgi:hypothetical protein
MSPVASARLIAAIARRAVASVIAAEIPNWAWVDRCWTPIAAPAASPPAPSRRSAPRRDMAPRMRAAVRPV